MKKVTIAVLIAGLALSAAVLPSEAAKPKFKPTKKFDAEVRLQILRGDQGDQYTPPGKARFFGTVETNKRMCTRNRTVRIHVKGKDHPASVFVETDNTGTYEFVRDEPVPGSQYRARALRKIKEGNPKKYRKGRKIVCRPGRSNIVLVP